MNCPTNAVFPGLEQLLSPERYSRVDNAIQSFFQRTLKKMSDGLPFIITGDIPAMWLRDSTWQARPLLKSHDYQVIQLLTDLSRAQVKLFLIDPYANAFNSEPNGFCWHKDFENQSPWVFERKYELDSWASILYLARKIHQNYGVTEHLDTEFESAVELMIELARKEQRHDPSSYVFQRENAVPHDSLSHGGKGAPTGFTGMVFSAFRPSDDACTYGYLIPANLFFANEVMAMPLSHFQSERSDLAHQIRAGVEKYGVKDEVLAYEVDGLGNQLFMDDANTPSLLSLPYLEALPASDSRYLKTREFLLSPSNPYFFTGSKATGIGSQHTPHNYVWPIAIAMAALTSQSNAAKHQTLELLESTDGGTGNMHESFDCDDDTKFTRPWFSWADMTYVDLVLESVHYQYPSGLND
jgi:meiotically up-regulated gene 157 (Mug157) protein